MPMSTGKMDFEWRRDMGRMDVGCFGDVNTVDFGRCGHVCDLRQSIDQ